MLLFQPAGTVALGRIAGLGEEREITSQRGGRESVKLRFVKSEQVSAKELKKFLGEHSRLT